MGGRWRGKKAIFMEDGKRGRRCDDAVRIRREKIVQRRERVRFAAMKKMMSQIDGKFFSQIKNW